MMTSAAWLLLASICRYGGQFALLALLTVAGPGAVGSYALSLAIAAPVFVLATLGMRTLFLTADVEQPLSVYERLRLPSSAAAVAVVALAGALLAPEALPTVVLVATLKAIESFGDLYAAALQKHGQPVAVAGSTAAVSAAGVLSAAAVLGSGGPANGALLGSALAGAAVTALVVRPMASARSRGSATGHPIPANGRPIRSLLAAGLPTGLAHSLITLVAAVPQYYLAASWGVVEVGRYAVLTYIVVAVEIVLNALAQSWIPHGRALHRDQVLDQAVVFATSRRWTSLVAPLGAAALGAAALILPRVVGGQYALTAAEFLPLACTVVTLPTVYVAETARAVRNQYERSLLTSALAVLLSLALSAALVPSYGVAGALWAAWVCHGARAVLGVLGRHEHGDVQVARGDRMR